MNHYDLADWIDYLRGLGLADSRAAMDRHLHGCAECQSALAALSTVSRHVRTDARFDPPDRATRYARAVFAQFRPERVSRLPRLVACLLQDSFRQPLPAGVRGNGRTSRQVLFGAGGILVDLRIEQHPGDPVVALVGQLMSADRSTSTPRGCLIVLTSGREVVTTITGNEYGEFHLEYIPAGRMRLHIPIDDGTRQIEISLDRLLSRRAAGRPGQGARGPRARPRGAAADDE